MDTTVQDFDLYYNAFIILLDDGEMLLQRNLIPYQSSSPDEYHTVIDGDTITGIAYKFYRFYTDDAPKYWKYIADANNITNPLDLTSYIGQSLLIPNYHLIKLLE
jgi:hypothetical protein